MDRPRLRPGRLRCRGFVVTGRVLAALACVLFVAAAPSAAPLDVHVKDVQAAASAVRTTIELRDIIPDRFKKMLDEGRVLHLRVQAELWESRPVWDRLVYPAIVRVFRLHRGASNREMSITDPDGAAKNYPAVPNPMPVVVDLGDRMRLAAAEKYYVHVVATLGTVAEREVEEVGDAVFGREAESNGLGSFGRLVVKTAVKVSDYLQSVSADAKSHKVPGAEILRRPPP